MAGGGLVMFPMSEHLAKFHELLHKKLIKGSISDFV